MEPSPCGPAARIKFLPDTRGGWLQVTEAVAETPTTGNRTFFVRVPKDKPFMLAWAVAHLLAYDPDCARWRGVPEPRLKSFVEQHALSLPRSIAQLWDSGLRCVAESYRRCWPIPVASQAHDDELGSPNESQKTYLREQIFRRIPVPKGWHGDIRTRLYTIGRPEAQAQATTIDTSEVDADPRFHVDPVHAEEDFVYDYAVSPTTTDGLGIVLRARPDIRDRVLRRLNKHRRLWAVVKRERRAGVIAEWIQSLRADAQLPRQCVLGLRKTILGDADSDGVRTLLSVLASRSPRSFRALWRSMKARAIVRRIQAGSDFPELAALVAAVRQASTLTAAEILTELDLRKVADEVNAHEGVTAIAKSLLALLNGDLIMWRKLWPDIDANRFAAKLIATSACLENAENCLSLILSAYPDGARALCEAIDPDGLIHRVTHEETFEHAHDFLNAIFNASDMSVVGAVVKRATWEDVVARYARSSDFPSLVRVGMVVSIDADAMSRAFPERVLDDVAACIDCSEKGYNAWWLIETLYEASQPLGLALWRRVREIEREAAKFLD